MQLNVHYMYFVGAFALFNSLGILMIQASDRNGFTFSRDPLPLVFQLGQSYPTQEESNECRPIKLRITKNSRLYTTDLVTNDNPNILFQTTDAQLMTTRMQDKLDSLAHIFLRGSNTTLRVLQAWSEYPTNDSDPSSLHYEGRSVKVQVRNEYVSFLLRAAIQVGFNWVKYESIEYVRLCVIPDLSRTSVDLVFLLDQSGTMGSNHEMALQFIHNVTSYYNISTNEAQIGMVTYSTSARIEFALNQYQSLQYIQQAVRAVPFRNGFTNIALALYYTKLMLTPSEDYGARPDSQGIPKVAILITDGQANLHPVSSYATDLKNSGVQVYTMGMDDVNLPELLNIASDPDVQYAFVLRTIRDAPYFVDFFSSIISETPALIAPGELITASVDEDRFRYFQSFCPAFSNSVGIEAIDSVGKSIIYASSSIKNPGPLSLAEVIKNESSDEIMKSISLMLTAEKYVYVAVRGVFLHNKFSIIIWNAIFMEDEYNVSVIANIPGMQIIFNLTSVLRPSNSTFLYSIYGGNDAGYFNVGLHSGIVSLNHSLNESRNGPIVLTLMGQNSKFSCNRGKFLLHITAISVNISLQKFSPAEVMENATKGERVAQAVVTHGILALYSIHEGPGSNLFNVDSSSGLVTVTESLDFETQSSYRLTVVAKSVLRTVLLDSAVLIVRILDINESPIFSNSCVPVCQLFIEENAPNLTTVGTLTFDDPDLEIVPNGQVTVTISRVQPPASFSLMQNEDSAAILANEVFDRETISSYTILITVTDKGLIPLFSTINLTINVIDINDNAPQFISFPSTVFIREMWPVQTLVTQYNSSDNDIGINAQTTYNISSNGESIPFEINPVSGVLVIFSPLDFEDVTWYDISVIASNPDGLSISALTTIFIEDDNDNAPIFNEAWYNTSLSENSSLGNFVLFVAASDADSGTRGIFDFKLLSVGNINNSFEITRMGNLTLSNVIDREQISVFNLTVAATDRGVPALNSFATILVWIEDINDNPPVFDQVIYNTSISEGDSIGTFVMLVEATDADSGIQGIVDFTLLSEGNLNNSFQITSTGNITISNVVDREQFSMFNLTVVAVDRGVPPLSSLATVIVMVEDLNDIAPIFDQPKYNASISEGDSVGKFVILVGATDADSDIRGIFDFTLLSAGNFNNSFQISGAGNVTLSNIVDREQIGQFNLTIAAVDRGVPPLSSLATVIVKVEDLNDNAPIFNQPIHNTSISEGDSIGTFVMLVEATDADSGIQGIVDFTLLSEGNLNNSFQITSTGNITIFNVVDREQFSMSNLTVVAVDRGVPPLSSLATVIVKVEDLNDNAPIFDQPKYNASINEGDSVGKFVILVGAADADSDIRGIFDFTLLSAGNFNNSFQISGAGNVTLSNIVDREQIGQFNLTIAAVDRGVPPLSSLATVIVMVEDLNDNAPIFNQPIHNTSIREGDSIGTFVMLVGATDADSGIQGIVDFILLSEGNLNNSFQITSTGNITIFNVVDREQFRMFNLTVVAVDRGVPPLSSLATVIVEVEDLNDNAPIFNQPIHNTSIREGDSIGTFVMLVEATDADSGIQGIVDFTLLSEGNLNNSFQITSTGNITIFNVVDREQFCMFNLTVVAVDRGVPPLSSLATVIVKVEDLNDNAPIFDQPKYNASINEGDSVGKFVILVGATDADSDIRGIFDFTLLSAGNFNNSFQISGAGNVTLSNIVDREQIGQFNLTIAAVDRGVPPLSSLATVIVMVEDLNDNAPIFNQPIHNTSISEGDSIGTFVMLVEAIDADSGIQGIVDFTLLSEGNLNNSFQITSTGNITISNVVDREQFRMFNLTVVAVDRGVPPLSSLATVIVKVEDLNDNAPIFDQPKYNASINEGDSVGKFVILVGAADADSDIRGIFDFTLLSAGNFNNSFQISGAGNVTLSNIVDREQIGQFNLTIAAVDRGVPPLSSLATVIVMVEDLNDNAPIFDQLIYNASISEGDSIGKFVILVGAADADSEIRSIFDFRLLPVGNFNNSFQISRAGNVSLSNTVDRERISIFNLTIAAIDRGVPPLTSYAMLIIMIEDINDNHPVFPEGNEFIYVSEDSDPMNILNITAYDIDSHLSLNSQIVFSLDILAVFGSMFNLTQVDSNNAILQLSGDLDYETVSIYMFKVVATDQGFPMLRSSITVIINVTDVNEAQATVTGIGSVKIRESAPLGFRFARLNVSTVNQTISVSLSNNSHLDNIPFKIDLINGTFYVAVNGTLDFETIQNFNLTIQSEFDGIIYLMVEIIDVNEFPPVFVSPRNFSIEEEQPSETFVGRVTAMDGDTGPFSGVKYSITQDSAAAFLFSINFITGDISTTQTLDREQLQGQNLFPPSRGSTETINVTATDITIPYHFGTATIQITLVDINEHSPILNTSSLQIMLSENQPMGATVHTVGATDNDIGPNGQVNYLLIPLELSIPLPLAIDNTGIIKTTAVLDAENISSFSMHLIAFDNGNPQKNSSALTFIVLVNDLNDNAPIFAQNSYNVSIRETAAIGSSVVVLEASDSDRDRPNSDFRLVIVSFNPSDAQELFNITFDGGNSSYVTVIGQLDFETLQQFTFVFEAIDNGIPSLSSRINVTINILNVDETPPKFSDSCSASISEGTAVIGMTVTQCFAVEIQDGSTTLLFGVPLMYNITSGNVNGTFSIDHMGTIHLRQSVDRETIDLYQLNISATDPGAQSSYQGVAITILDDNDNPPIVTNPNSMAFVSTSNILNNVTNFFTVMATDADIGINAELNFAVSNFIINENGTVTEITIIVSNRGGAFPIMTTVTLELEIPCVFQNHHVNSSTGKLISSMLCNVSVVPDDVNVVVSGTLELGCFVTANFVPERYQFTHNGQVISNYSKSLMITNVTLAESGEYTCIAITEFGTIQSLNQSVQVQVPPNITLSSMNVHVPVNTQTVVTCSAPGTDNATFSWSRMVSGSQVSEPIVDVPGDRFLINGGLLINTLTQLSDAGIYICTVASSMAENSASFTLSVFTISSIVQPQVKQVSSSNRVVRSSGMVTRASVICNDTNQQELELGANIIITELSHSNSCESYVCNSSLCHNGGLCILQSSLSSGFYCYCAPGYMGLTCAEDIDECLEDPCQFGGTCINSPEGAFTCICRNGYVGLQCQYRNVCSNATCPEGKMCIHTITNSDGFVCHNITSAEAAQNLRVIVYGSNYSNETIGSLCEHNHQIPISSGQEKRMAIDNFQLENNKPFNNDPGTSCEAQFIPDPFFIPDSGTSLLLVWICTGGISPPSTHHLNTDCNKLFHKFPVIICSSPSGVYLKISSTDNSPIFSFTFKFTMLNSNRTLLSEMESLNLLSKAGTLDKLKDLLSYLVPNLDHMVSVPVATEHPISSIIMKETSVVVRVSTLLPIVIVLITIEVMIILIATCVVVLSWTLLISSRERGRETTCSYNSTSENTYHSCDVSEQQLTNMSDSKVYYTETNATPASTSNDHYELSLVEKQELSFQK